MMKKKFKVSLHGDERGYLDVYTNSVQDVHELVNMAIQYGLDVDIDQVKDDAEQDH